MKFMNNKSLIKLINSNNNNGHNTYTYTQYRNMDDIDKHIK